MDFLGFPKMLLSKIVCSHDTVSQHDAAKILQNNKNKEPAFDLAFC